MFRYITYTCIIIVWLLAGYGLLLVVDGKTKVKLVNRLNVDNESLATSLANNLNKVRLGLPQLQDSGLVKRYLIRNDAEDLLALNKLFHANSLVTKAEKIFLVDESGDIVALGQTSEQTQASQSLVVEEELEPKYFVGANIRGERYFQQSIQGELAEYYSVTQMQHSPKAYFFSFPILFNNKSLGVLVYVVDINELVSLLSVDDPKVTNYMVGIDGVVFASSQKSMDYATVSPITDRHKSVLIKYKRYGEATFNPISDLSKGDFFEKTHMRMNLNGVSREYMTARTPIVGSSLLLFSSLDRRAVYGNLLNVISLYVLASALFFIGWLYSRHRENTQRHLAEMNAKLESRVDTLTSGLKRSNNELRELVTHYKSSQENLEQTQYELLQTARLAALGELSATLNHELSQPALALRVYTENSMKLLERGEYDTVASNFKEMHSICQSMGNIVSTIKTFSKQSSSQDMRVTSLYKLVQSSLPIVNHLIQKSGAQLVLPEKEANIFVRCIPEQLEQVLVNLISNAAHAVHKHPNGRVEVAIGSEGDKAKMMVRNNNVDTELSEEQLEQMFDPYFTTKEDGLGIGLALCKRIVEAQDGKIKVRICANGDIEFDVTMKLREKS